MKIIFTLFLCAFFSFNLFGQTEQNQPASPPDVAELSLARDDGNGDFGEETKMFSPNDIPIHCSVLFDRPGAVAVKMEVVAVKAEGLKPDSKIVKVSFKTGDEDNRVNFKASPAKVWHVGRYRVDIFLDGKLAQSADFEVVGTAK
ncbi:MAG: hypothetical protein R2747_21975 [Pyrinomonadaceae bacterium]